MKINQEILGLLNETQKQFSEIKTIYDSLKKDDDVPISLKTRIKNFLENDRSVLDHIASQIFHDEKLIGKENEVYFPLYCKNKSSFENFMKNKFPGLIKNSILYSKLETIQYYNDPKKRDWMKDLRIVNENKHRKFSEQEKRDASFLEIGGRSGKPLFRVGKGVSFTLGSLSMDGIPIPKTVTFSYDGDDPQIEGLFLNRIKIGEFRFSQLNKPVISTLQQILVGTKELVEKLSSAS